MGKINNFTLSNTRIQLLVSTYHTAAHAAVFSGVCSLEAIRKEGNLRD